MSLGKKHLVIPDTQCKPGQDLTYLDQIGRLIVDGRPDVILHLGDCADMPSLSTHDKAGSKYFEGKRYTEDVFAAKAGMARLLQPLKELQSRQKKNKDKLYKPRLVFTTGNHEMRIDRAVENNPILEGVISRKDLGFEKDWEVHEFLDVVVIDGIAYSHYFPAGSMGRPCATASALLNKHHMSCIAGHQQGRQVAYGKAADGRHLTCIIAGSSYPHDEHYLNSQTNNHWRGVVVLTNVHNGQFDEHFVSLNTLRQRYNP